MSLISALLADILSGEGPRQLCVVVISTRRFVPPRLFVLAWLGSPAATPTLSLSVPITARVARCLQPCRTRLAIRVVSVDFNRCHVLVEFASE